MMTKIITMDILINIHGKKRKLNIKTILLDILYYYHVIPIHSKRIS